MPMTRKKFEALVEREAARSTALLEQKGKDYDHGNDVLGRLCDDARKIGVTPRQCLMIHLRKQFAALERWSRDGELMTQDPQERIRDAVAYLMLGLALIEEGEA